MQNAVEILKKVEKEAKEKAIQDVRYIGTIYPGQVIRQGDIYLLCVEKSHPVGEQTLNRQLAPGNSMGSRHCIEGNVNLYIGVKAPEWCKSNLVGPVIVARERFKLVHPEHAHFDMPAGYFQTIYQLDPRTMMRVEE